MACYHHVVRPDAKTLVYFHGNGEVVADCVATLAQPFAALGFNSFFAEYRGYGLSSGVPALGAMLDDVPLIIKALGIPERDLVLFGRSVGSIYAIHATAHFPNVAGLVIESGVADPLERLLLRVRPEELGVTMKALEEEAAERLNHRRLLSDFTRPSLFLHARHDDLVPLDNAERAHAWAGGPKSLEVFERGDHNSILLVNFATYMSKVKEFVESLDHLAHE